MQRQRTLASTMRRLRNLLRPWLALLLGPVVWALALATLVAARLPARKRRPARAPNAGDLEASALTYASLAALSEANARGGTSRRVAQRACRFVYFLGSRLMNAGRLRGSERCMALAVDLCPADSWQKVAYARVLGASRFMLADLPGAHDAFRLAGTTRRRLLARGIASSRVRNLGPGWMVAIGHVAMLDFYFKQRALGWADPECMPVATFNLSGITGGLVAQQYIRHGLTVASDEGIRKAYDRLREPHEVAWKDMRADDHFAIIDDFWEYDFPDGEVLTYTHGAARIQQRWEAEGRPPLIQLTAAQRAAGEALKRTLGIPAGAWFVCLHVREAGFHARWNRMYPTARDAEIGDYRAAIEAVTERGGWVVRMGDASMQRLPPMPGVIDYAHGPHKSEIGDMLLPAICRFFIGTNSGFATLPGIYGTPNVLTNWVPIALPLWFGQDIMLPKMFWNRETASWVGFREMMSTRLGATQNLVDIPAHIEVRANQPGEIREAVVEMIRRLDGEHLDTEEDIANRQRFFRFAERCGSYRGSAPGRDFLRRFQHLLPQDDATLPPPGHAPAAAAAGTDTTTPPPTPASFHDVTENSRAAVPASRRTA